MAQEKGKVNVDQSSKSKTLGSPGSTLTKETEDLFKKIFLTPGKIELFMVEAKKNECSVELLERCRPRVAAECIAR